MKGAVEIETRDGVTLRGELERAGPIWLVLAHDTGSDLDSWRPLALAGRGISVLTIDLRGHGGSDGEPDRARTALDLADVIAFARGTGAEVVVIGAAGETVAPALDAAAEARASGLIAVAPCEEQIEGGSLSKLVIVASGDDRQVSAGLALQRSSGSAFVVNLPIAGGCAEIVSGAWRTNVEAYFLRFVREAVCAFLEVSR